MPGFFSAATLEQIRAASDIVEVIGSYLPLKRAGANFVALCPFHKEKTPSFNVSPHRQIFHCFGCHKGGDVFGFVKEFENIDFPEAVRRLADRAKIPLEYEKNAGEQQSRHLKERLLQIHEQIAQRWQNALANEASGQIARDYLAKRSVPDEAVKLFRLGAAPDLWDDTVNWAKSKGHDLALVEQAGLILRRQEGEGYYDRFRGRLMFPICDEQGRVVGFSGRVLSGDEKTAKYVNSPETPIFTKSKVFFGLDKSKRAVLDAGYAIVCEGQLDLIACYMAGIQNVVAPQGTAFTGDHIRILKRYTGEVVLCFDSDEAGQNAAMRSLDNLLASDLALAAAASLLPDARSLHHLLASGLAVRVAFVPAPHDPDSFIKEFGGSAFREIIEKAEGFFDYYLRRLCVTNDPTTDKGRLAISRAMANAIQQTGNAVLIDTYAKKTAFRIGVTPEALRAEFKKAPKPKVPGDPGPAPVDASRTAPQPPSHEFWLLKLLLRHDDLVPWAAAHLDPGWVQHELVRQIVAQRLAAHATQTWTTLPAFLGQCEAPEMQRLITEATTESRTIPNPSQQLADVALRLRNQFIDRQLADSLQRTSQPDCSEPERLDLLRQQEELRRLKRQPIEATESNLPPA
jgi:DNA primase